MNLKTKNKAFWVVYSIYIILFLVDVCTTLMNGELANHLEINPLFLLTGSFLSIIVLNLVILYFLWWAYVKPRATPTTRFLVMNQMVLVNAARIFAIKNALHWYFNPITIEAAATTYTTAVKTAAVTQMSWLMYLPLIISIVTFLIWKIDHTVEKKHYGSF